MPGSLLEWRLFAQKYRKTLWERSASTKDLHIIKLAMLWIGSLPRAAGNKNQKTKKGFPEPKLDGNPQR